MNKLKLQINGLLNSYELYILTNIKINHGFDVVNGQDIL